MNDWSVMYIEKNIIDNIDNETFIQWFQNMKTHTIKKFVFYVFTSLFGNVNIFKFYLY